MDIAAIRNGIKARLVTIDGLAAHTQVPASVNPPAAIITTQTPFIEYHLANAKGLAQLNFNIQLLVGRQDERRAQELLDQYLSAGTGVTKSIIDAFEADTTLSGSCSSSIIMTAGEYFATDLGDSSYGSVILPLTVYAPRI